MCDIVFCKLWVHAVEIEKSVFNWNEMDVVGCWFCWIVVEQV